jgi:hypothetical protein
MAQRVQVLLIDDIDGTEGAETITFALDGVSYEIDLSSKNAAKLRDAVAPYVGHARKVGARRSGGGRRSAASGNGPSAREIREWARANGWNLSDRGRVAAEVRQAYEAAN